MGAGKLKGPEAGDRATSYNNPQGRLSGCERADRSEAICSAFPMDVAMLFSISIVIGKQFSSLISSLLTSRSDLLIFIFIKQYSEESS